MEAISNAQDMIIDMAANDTNLDVEAMAEGVSEVLHNLTSTTGLTADLTGTSAVWGLAACILALVSFLVSAVLGLWRFWAFTVWPRLHPDEPKELPSWFPYIGHAWGYLDDSHALVSFARDYLSDTDEPYDQPFAMTISGQKVYILTSSKDAAAAFADEGIFARDDHLKEMMLKLGVSASAMNKIWNGPSQKDPRHANPNNPQQKALQRCSEDIHRQQLLPGEKLDEITDKLCNILEKSFRYDDLPRRHVGWKTGKTVPLLDFCADIALTPMIRSLVGDSVYDIKPDFSHSFYVFNEEAWKILLVQYPKYAARKLHRAKHGVLEVLHKFIQSPMDLQNEESWLVTNVLEEQKAAGLEDKDRAALLFMLLTTANLNIYRLTFWLLSYALFNKDLLALIKTETAPAFQTSGQINPQHIYQNCNRFSAVYTEMLRLTVGSTAIRTITTHTKMSSKTLKAGNKVLIPLRALHYNETFFGDNTEEFVATRFLNNDLETSPHFRPFAGGIPDPAGQSLTKRTTMLLVATVLHRFEVEVVPNPLEGEKTPRIPEIDQASLTMGVMEPVKGTEVYVKVREREE